MTRSNKSGRGVILGFFSRSIPIRLISIAWLGSPDPYDATEHTTLSGDDPVTLPPHLQTPPSRLPDATLPLWRCNARSMRMEAEYDVNATHVPGQSADQFTE